jgi:hypothetical protein
MTRRQIAGIGAGGHAPVLGGWFCLGGEFGYTRSAESELRGTTFNAGQLGEFAGLAVRPEWGLRIAVRGGAAAELQQPEVGVAIRRRLYASLPALDRRRPTDLDFTGC